MGIGNAPGARLKTIVERIERLEIDRKAVVADIGEVFAEAKGDGFDVKIIRKVIKLRAMDKAKRQEEADLIDLYMFAIEGGDFPETDRDPASQPPAPAPSPTLDPAQRGPSAPIDSEALAYANGREAGRAGVAITANPYRAGTPQRTAWDRAWCDETGTDGMDIPADLKPSGSNPDDKKSGEDQ